MNTIHCMIVCMCVHTNEVPFIVFIETQIFQNVYAIHSIYTYSIYPCIIIRLASQWAESVFNNHNHQIRTHTHTNIDVILCCDRGKWIEHERDGENGLFETMKKTRKKLKHEPLSTPSNSMYRLKTMWIDSVQNIHIRQSPVAFMLLVFFFNDYNRYQEYRKGNAYKFKLRNDCIVEWLTEHITSWFMLLLGKRPNHHSHHECVCSMLENAQTSISQVDGISNHRLCFTLGHFPSPLRLRIYGTDRISCGACLRCVLMNHWNVQINRIPNTFHYLQSTYIWGEYHIMWEIFNWNSNWLNFVLCVCDVIEL